MPGRKRSLGKILKGLWKYIVGLSVITGLLGVGLLQFWSYLFPTAPPQVTTATTLMTIVESTVSVSTSYIVVTSYVTTSYAKTFIITSYLTTQTSVRLVLKVTEPEYGWIVGPDNLAGVVLPKDKPTMIKVMVTNTGASSVQIVSMGVLIEFLPKRAEYGKTGFSGGREVAIRPGESVYIPFAFGTNIVRPQGTYGVEITFTLYTPEPTAQIKVNGYFT